jgi:hypothetical protein
MASLAEITNLLDEKLSAQKKELLDELTAGHHPPEI